ncbi:hypothetical protein S101520_01744 [Lactiplantibacillus plantarum subsp. plantarum]|nr:hypothetical protein S101520_01744 [Lactiplantibacillus plantarum subsp. plantarum]
MTDKIVTVAFNELITQLKLPLVILSIQILISIKFLKLVIQLRVVIVA